MFPATVRTVQGREIIDSRGNPTVEVVLSAGSVIATEQVPSGASTGMYEAKELRDGGSRFLGKGVLKAVNNVSILAGHVRGMPLGNQALFDKTLIDVNPSKVRIGANAMLGCSLAYARASASARGLPLATWLSQVASTKRMSIPVPYMNIINGGKHAGTSLSFQEHMIVPRAASFAESLRIACEVYQTLHDLLKAKYGPSAANVGDEGGFAPNAKDAAEPFVMLDKAVQSLGYTKEIRYAIDAAASSFYDKKRQQYNVCGKWLSTDKMHDLYERLSDRFPLVSIEDPFEEHKAEDYALLKHAIGKKVQIVGDDLTVSQPERVKDALRGNEISCLLLKVNQVGTVSEAMEAARIARDGGANVMVSHRSGETESTFIADLAVGLGCGQIKTGAPARGERTAKYNQLLRLEEELGSKAKFAGHAGWK